MATNKRYELDYKVKAVKLARETGQTKAAKELGISTSTLRGWCLAADEGRLDLGLGTQKSQTALTLAEEVAQLRKQVKGKLSFYCKILEVSRQAFYDYLERQDKIWKYQYVAYDMYEILEEDLYNDTYGRYHMYQLFLIVLMRI